MKIVVCGNYGAQNEGDEMILTGLLKSIKSAHSKAKITILSADPAQTQKRHKTLAVRPVPTGIRSLFKIANSGTVKAIKECDTFILGGGGLFAGPSFRANFIWVTQVQMAFFYKKPVIMYGQSIGKIKNHILKFLIKRVFNTSQLIAVRDTQSSKNLKEIGIKKAIHILPDLAFRYTEKIIEQKNKIPKTIIALREMDGLNKNFYKEVGDFIKWLKKEQNTDISYINFQEGNCTDNKIHKILTIKLKKAKHQELKNADSIIGMRLHSIISSIKNEKPFIAINYFSKIKNLLKDVGLEKYSIDLKDITTNSLKEKYELIKKDKKQIIKKMHLYNASAKEKLLEFEKNILKKHLTK